MTVLRDLDERLLPGLGTRLAATLAWLDHRQRQIVDRLARRLAQRERRRLALHPESPLGRLASLDARIPATSPLAALRDRPGVAALAVSLVLLGGVSFALAQKRPSLPDAVPAQTQSANGSYVGPQVGDDIPSYVAARQRELAARAAQAPAQVGFAVVSLGRYESPQQAAKLLRGITAKRVFFRVRIAHEPTEVAQAPIVRGLLADTLASFHVNATERSKLAVQFKHLADRTPTASADQRRFRDFYRTLAHSSAIESKALARDCDCVFAVVVQARMSALLALQRIAGVRLVDVGPPNSNLTDLGFRGLLPEETDKVDNGGQIRPNFPLH